MWRNVLIDEKSTLRSAIAAIDEGGQQIALVVDQQGRLLGTVTDGDVRRAILGGQGLDEPAIGVANRNPAIARLGDGRDAMLARMRSQKLHQLPVVDDKGIVVGIESIDGFLEEPQEDSWVVLMAGGLGKRLSPLTDDKPKPLLDVGNKPILEIILDGLVAHGFHNIFISVNYRADMVKDRFGDGSDRGINIRYLEEDRELGTAGALSLLPEDVPGPFLVMNGDLLTNLNYRHLLAYHREQGGRATVCVCEETIQIPYGIVEVVENRLVAIEEKPVRQHFINAGVYVLEPDALKLAPRNARLDMPDLIGHLIKDGGEVSVFPIREFWLDIGHHDDYKAANSHYERLFK